MGISKDAVRTNYPDMVYNCKQLQGVQTMTNPQGDSLSADGELWGMLVRLWYELPIVGRWVRNTLQI